MWKWLKRPTNQKTLAFVGSGVVAIAIAAWTVYTHFAPAQTGGSEPSVRVEGGVGAGGDISVGGDLTVTPPNEPEQPAK